MNIALSRNIVPIRAVCAIITVFLHQGIANGRINKWNSIPSLYSIYTNQNGTAISLQKGVCLVGMASARWRFLHAEFKNVERVVGLTPKGVFVVEDDNDVYSLKRVNPDARVETINGNLGSPIVDFVDENVGVIGRGRSVRVTTDGGVHWGRRTDVLPPHDTVRSVRWIDPGRVAVASEGGDVFLLSPAALTPPIWTTQCGNQPIDHLVPDGAGHIWLLSQHKALELLADSGAIVNSIDVDPYEGSLAAGGGRMYAYNSKGTQIWDVTGGPGKSKLLKTFDNPIVDEMFVPEPGPVAVGEDEPRLYSLKDDRVVPIEVEVETVGPTTRPTTDPDEATDQAVREAIRLSKRVDFATRERIFGQVNARHDLTGRQQVQLATEQFKRILAASSRPATRP